MADEVDVLALYLFLLLGQTKAPNGEADKGKTKTCLGSRNLSSKTTSGRLP